MKPFDLEKALAGEPVVTRDGRPVKIAGYNPDARGHANIAGWCEDYIIYWRQDGTWYADGTLSNTDLFMAEKPKAKREGWVVLCDPYGEDGVIKECATNVYATKQDAEKHATNYLNDILVKVEWEEEA